MTISRGGAYALIVLSSVAWSLGGLFVRMLALPSLSMLFWRALFAGCFLMVISAFSGLPAMLTALRAKPWRGFVIILCAAVGTGLFIPAVEHTSVAHVALIYATLPVIVALLARVHLREPLMPRVVVSALMILIGVAVLTSGHNEDGQLLGDILALAVTLAMAVVTVAARHETSGTLLFYFGASNILVALCAVLIAPVGGDLSPVKFAGLAAFGLLQAGAGCGFAALAVPRLPAVETAVITTLEAPLALMWVWLVLSETPSVRSVIGGVIIVATVLVYVSVGPKAALHPLRQQ